MTQREESRAVLGLHALSNLVESGPNDYKERAWGLNRFQDKGRFDSSILDMLILKDRHT